LDRRAIVTRLILGWLVVDASCATARGDGGIVRLLERKPPYRIAVFTAPTPFRAGPVDVSVLVQDATTSEPIPDAEVSVTMTPRARPLRALRRPATTEAATNKLLRAALFELPEPGWWEVAVAIKGVEGEAQVGFALEASDPAPKWLAVWPWLAWPAPVVVLFGVHQYLVWRREGQKASLRKGSS
jgi:hypothetical protein